MRCRAIVFEQVAFIQHNNIAPTELRQMVRGATANYACANDH
jgi:hypothetical protein